VIVANSEDVITAKTWTVSAIQGHFCAGFRADQKLKLFDGHRSVTVLPLALPNRKCAPVSGLLLNTAAQRNRIRDIPPRSLC